MSKNIQNLNNFRGTRGVRGDKGDSGSGTKGDTGVKGDIGDKGEKGDSTLSSGGSSSNFTLKNTNATIGDLLVLSNQDGIGLYQKNTPTFQWAVNAGGISIDYGQCITTDNSGNLYISGLFSETAVFGAITLISNGNLDIFVAKMNPAGAFLWAIGIGGTNAELGQGIAVDSLGDIYITGNYRDTVSFGATTLVSSGSDEIYVAKLDTNGNHLWALSFGATGVDIGRSIACNNTGCWVTGGFQGTVSFGGTSLVSSGSTDCFVTRINNLGVIQWAIKAGSAGLDSGYGIVIDVYGNSYIAGDYTGTLTLGSLTLAPLGSADGFIAKINPTGTFLWALRMGGANFEAVRNIGIDSLGNIYTSGAFRDSFTIGSLSVTGLTGGQNEIFVTKVSSSGVPLWLIRAGSTSSDRAWSLAVDNNGNSFVTGSYVALANFGLTEFTSAGLEDLFIFKLNKDGEFQWVISAGSLSTDEGLGICSDNQGNCFVTGRFNQTVSFGPTSLVAAGSQDIFITKISDINGLIVVANASGLIGNSISASWGGIVNSFSGLTIGSLYYFNPPNLTPTTTMTPYKIGYALSATSILFEPAPKYT